MTTGRARRTGCTSRRATPESTWCACQTQESAPSHPRSTPTIGNVPQPHDGDRLPAPCARPSLVSPVALHVAPASSVWPRLLRDRRRRLQAGRRALPWLEALQPDLRERHGPAQRSPRLQDPGEPLPYLLDERRHLPKVEVLALTADQAWAPKEERQQHHARLAAAAPVPLRGVRLCVCLHRTGGVLCLRAHAEASVVCSPPV